MTDSQSESKTDDPLSWREVRDSERSVRHYSADGTLYAYRDGDDHVVVSRGRDAPTRWSKTVPAERHAVLAGGHMWTIPDNWQHRVSINSDGDKRCAVYHIPETGVDVLVHTPTNCRLADAWYAAERVGELSVTYDDEIAWHDLDETIAHREDDDTISTETLDALRQLYQRRHSVEQVFTEAVDEYAEESLLHQRETPVTLDGWTTEPWMHPVEIGYDIQTILDIDNETHKAVMRELSNGHGSVIPSYPTVRVDVAEDVALPAGYEMRALAEAGASGAEAMDYLATEHHGLMNQTEWAAVRDKTPSAVNKNVRKAKRHLSN
jgi:hypothetical protein